MRVALSLGVMIVIWGGFFFFGVDSWMWGGGFVSAGYDYGMV